MAKISNLPTLWPTDGIERGTPDVSGSRGEISFSVASYEKRTLATIAPGGVSLVPFFSASSEGKTRRPLARFAPLVEASGFKGEIGETFIAPAGNASLLHFGLGPREKFDVQSWRDALAAAFKAVRSLKTSQVHLVLPDGLLGAKPLFGSMSLFEIGEVTAQVIGMTAYSRNHYKTAAAGFNELPSMKNVVVCGAGLSVIQKSNLLLGLAFGRSLAVSVKLARDWANEPANICTPSFLSQKAREIANQSGGTIITQVFGRDQCAAKQMNCFLAVAKGSDEQPQFIVMEYFPLDWRMGSPVLGLVGKGVTFDSGGLDIKPADGMRGMEYDMCGAADVIAAMQAIAAAGLPIRVKAFVAATENMTGGSAYRPGDVYVGADGKSRVVDNTDAEGRLTLVDAIAVAIRDFGVTHVVDYATLTGACVIALGDVYAGVVSNNQAFADQYLAAAASAGELCHQFPVSEKYKKQNQSPVGDFKNTGGRKAGTITAGLFVLEAAGQTPAVHVDIAGVANRDAEDGAYPAGGTGWGVLTLFALARNMAKAAAA